MAWIEAIGESNNSHTTQKRTMTCETSSTEGVKNILPTQRPHMFFLASISVKPASSHRATPTKPQTRAFILANPRHLLPEARGRQEPSAPVALVDFHSFAPHWDPGHDRRWAIGSDPKNFSSAPNEDWTHKSIEKGHALKWSIGIDMQVFNVFL